MALSRQSRLALDATMRERQGPPEPGRSDFTDSMGLAASEVAAAIGVHEAAADPHPGYTTATELSTAVSTAINALIAGAPGVLDTIDELAAALGDDPNFATTITTLLAAKAPLASPAFTGNPTAPTQSVGDNSTKLATTAYADAAAGTPANDSVTNAKLANMAVNTVKARKTAGTGDPEDCSLSELLDFIGSAAQGDILYRGASGWARLPAGTANNVLITAGAGFNPAWGVVPSGAGGAMTLLAAPAVVSGGAATVLTLPGLDLSLYKSIMLFFELENATASAATISLFLSGDTTTTNYYREAMTVSSTTVGANRSNDAAIIVLAANDTATGTLIAQMARDSKVRTQVLSSQNAPVSIAMRNSFHARNVTGNMTDVTLSSSVANSLANGCRLTAFGVN